MVFTFEFDGVQYSFETLEALNAFITEKGIDAEKAAVLVAQFNSIQAETAAELTEAKATVELTEAEAAAELTETEIAAELKSDGIEDGNNSATDA